MKKDIGKIKAGRRFYMTQVYNANQPYNHHPDIVVKDGKVYETREVEVNWVEDCGEYLYIGYTPKTGGAFGATRVYKEADPYEYGTKGFEAKYPYEEGEE